MLYPLSGFLYVIIPSQSDPKDKTYRYYGEIKRGKDLV
jgi:hypothetical protein